MENYNYQITIIYPQREDQSLSESDRIWVSEFKKYLEAFLRQLLDISLQINQLSIHSENQSAAEIVAASATFIYLMSPDFVKEDRYLRYLEELHEIQGKQSVNRLFQAVKFPVNEESLPKWMQYNPQYTFFDKKPNTRKFIELDFSREVVEGHPVWEKFNDLVYDIDQTIKRLQEVNTQNSSGNQISVFVAETTPDQEENRHKIIRELKQKGYNVYPNYKLSNRSKEIEPELKDMLDKCVMSIHLLGGLYGTYLKDSRYSITDYLNRTVRAYMQNLDSVNRKFKRIIWIPPYLRISDQRQDLFLGRLKREENDAHTELIQSPLEDLKSLVFNTIENISTASEKYAKGPCVYLIHDPLVHPDIDEYISFFSDNDIEVSALNFDNEHSLIEQHINNLKECDAVLIIDNANQNWLEAKLRDIIKIKGYGRENPFIFKAIVTSSDNEFKPDEKLTQDVVYLNGSDNLVSVLEPFLKKMEESHA